MTDHNDLRHEINDILEARKLAKGGFKLESSVVIQIIAWVVAALLTYGAVNSRIAVVESELKTTKEQYQSLSRDVSEIRNDVKTLLRRP